MPYFRYLWWQHRSRRNEGNITGAMHHPEYNFSVFSITKRLQNEWVLSGNNKNIMLMKSNKNIKFDMVIPISFRAIYTSWSDCDREWNQD